MITRKNITPIEIIDQLHELLGVSKEEIMNRSRKAHNVMHRQMAIWLAHKYCKMKLVDIARVFNRRHSTAIHAIKNVDGLRSYSKPYRLLMDGVEASIRGISIDQSPNKKKVL